jgi:hypothetical protein
MSAQSRNYCQGFCTLCGTACEEYTREVLSLKAEIASLDAVAKGEIEENARLTTALQAIAAKGEASPGDKKARMARDALAPVKKS